MEQEIKNLRVRIDGLKQLTDNLCPIKAKGDSTISKWNTQEIEEAVKSLLLAKAWLGKVLGELGTESPYSSGKKTVEDIEPTADKPSINQSWDFSTRDEINPKCLPWEIWNHIEKVDWLRSEIQKIIDELAILQIENKAFHNSIYQHLSEARFWLGFEFERIRNKDK